MSFNGNRSIDGNSAALSPAFPLIPSPVSLSSPQLHFHTHSIATVVPHTRACLLDYLANSVRRSGPNDWSAIININSELRGPDKNPKFNSILPRRSASPKTCVIAPAAEIATSPCAFRDPTACDMKNKFFCRYQSLLFRKRYRERWCAAICRNGNTKN